MELEEFSEELAEERWALADDESADDVPDWVDAYEQ